MRIRAGSGERRRPGVPWALVFALVLLASFLALAYAFASYAVYDTLAAVTGECHPDDAANTPERFRAAGLDDAVTAQYAMPAPEDIEFRSRDPRIADLTLRGWWIPGRTADAPSVIVVHGLKSCRRDENVLLAAGMLHRNGFGVLLMDQRDHGDSDDEDLRFAAGTEEYLDVLGAWDWLAAQGVPEERIGILGMSFGAATTLIAGGEEPRVRAVWADSSFADMDEAIRDYLTHEGYPTILAPGGELAARVVAGDDLTATSPLREIPAYAGRPLAIVHGTGDTLLSSHYAEQLRDAAEASGADLREFWLAEGAEHTRAITERRSEYEPRLIDFFTGALGPP
jgi:dipeptidyl aminopeptidase/acylaminoacyl peptidase